MNLKSFLPMCDLVFNTSINLDPGMPKNEKEAEKLPDWNKWKGGMWKEFDNFIKRDA